MRNNNTTRKDKFKSRRVAPENYLIVCEGKKTEPNYFNGLKKMINDKFGSKVDVVIPNIDIKGIGKNTEDLINYTKRYVNLANKIYGKVFVIFDKDDYNDEQFNSSIKDCPYNAIWSNPNFEVWLLSHFKKLNSYITKDEVFKELDKEFRKNNLNKYYKNDVDIFNKVTKKNGLSKAMVNSLYMEKLNNNKLPANSNPMTKVYKIFENLREYL